MKKLSVKMLLSLLLALSAIGSTVWLVADFKAHSYQVTTTLDAG